MIRTRRFTQAGTDAFRRWLEHGVPGSAPLELLNGAVETEDAYDVEIDPSRIFASRLEFGKYLNSCFNGIPLDELLAEENDGLWNWLAAVYIAQLAPKEFSRTEHYIVTRSGIPKPLVYRHAVRTSFELVAIHGDNAAICLNRPMSIFGDLAEQLASRQVLAHHRGFFSVACALYMRNGRVQRGAGVRLTARHKRRRGDKTGMGGPRRLALTLQRLDLLYDTESMSAEELKSVLPREFSKWIRES